MSDDLLANYELKRAFGLIDPPSNDKTHYENLGRFMAAFANAEGILHSVARHISGLEDEKARILFGGMRLSDITDRIRGFIRLDTTKGTVSDDFIDITACLDQIGHIATRRHNIVHRGATYFGGAFIVSNAMIAKTLAGIESEIVSEQTLKDMTADCNMIFLRLRELQQPENTLRTNWRHHLRQAAWRYKPPEPKPQNPKRPDTRRSRKRQPPGD